MIIHTFPQKSDEWREKRRGLITASEVGAFVYNNDAKARGAKHNLIKKKLAEKTGWVEADPFVSDDMKRGTALEPIVRAYYEQLAGVYVREIGLLEHETLPIACSPDGLVIIGDNGDGYVDFQSSVFWSHGCELKAPIEKTMIEYLLAGGLPSEYYHQIIHSLMISKLPFWDFFAFCPVVTEWIKTRDGWTVMEWHPGDLPPIWVRVHAASNNLAEYEAGIVDLCEQYRETHEKVKARCLAPVVMQEM